MHHRNRFNPLSSRASLSQIAKGLATRVHESVSIRFHRGRLSHCGGPFHETLRTVSIRFHRGRLSHFVPAALNQGGSSEFQSAFIAGVSLTSEVLTFEQLRESFNPL